MKKLWRTSKYKAYMRRRARDSLAGRLRFKEYLRRKRQGEEGVPKEELKALNSYVHRNIPVAFVKAPEQMKFVRNPEEMCRFLARLDECFKKRRPVFVILKDVKGIDYDGITVLLSVMVRFKATAIEFNGNFPRDPSVKKMLDESNFFRHLRSEEFWDQDEYDLTAKSSILTHAMRTVDSELGQKIIGNASKTVWGEKRRCPGVQRTLIELMQNTINHASLEKEGEKHWWLSVKYLEEEKRVVFSFVDYGVGVFENLRNNSPKNRWVQAYEDFFDYLAGKTNADVLRLIFSGALHKTASQKYYRGKGLPGIYHAHSKNQISNLAMVTNDVFFDSSNSSYNALATPFAGTFVSWELCSDNVSLQDDS